MLDMELRFEDGTVQTRCVALPLEIGREPKAGLYLKAWRVARRHALIEQHEGGVFIEDFGALSGTLVNGRRITRYGPLIVGDEIVIGPCLIRIRALPVALVVQAAGPASSGSNPAPAAVALNIPADAPVAVHCVGHTSVLVQQIGSASWRESVWQDV